MAATISKQKSDSPKSERQYPLLDTGYHLSADEFHTRYQKMPEHVRAELIEGIVYMASPLYSPHGDQHFLLASLCGAYQLETPGVIGSIATSVRLDGKNEYQPDLHLRLDPKCGGRTRNPDKKMIWGGPEFVCEISNTTVEMDLHEKFDVYQRDGVLEYLAWQLQEEKLDLFGLQNGVFQKVSPDAHGILRSLAMPGLWLNVTAMLAGDKVAASATLRAGLQSAEHTKFVKQLQGVTN
jgi:Uma2 family endonuclease